MSTKRESDQERQIRLLWRQPRPEKNQRGPRPGLTVDRIVDVAIELADQHGIRAVTMRRIAEKVKVATMSVYTYVEGKVELLDLMLDKVYQLMPRQEIAGKPWRLKVEIIAQENRDLYGRHPWVVRTTPHRPPLGPGLIAKYNHELSAFVDLGLDEVEMDAALTYVLSFVQASTLSTFEAVQVKQNSGRSDQDWWAENAPLLARVFDENQYPLAARVGAAAGAAYQGAYNAAYAYEFGLQRVLDGLGVLIEERQG